MYQIFTVISTIKRKNFIGMLLLVIKQFLKLFYYFYTLSILLKDIKIFNILYHSITINMLIAVVQIKM